MANVTTEQVAAYIRDNNVQPSDYASLSAIFGVPVFQMENAAALLSSGQTRGVDEASAAYAASASPAQDAENKRWLAEQRAAQAAGVPVTPPTPAPVAPTPPRPTPAPPTTAVGALTQAAAPRTAANNWGDADIRDAAHQLYSAMQQMTASGNEAGAKALYNEKKRLFGFTDEQFSPIAVGADGVAFTPQQITQWASSPNPAPAAGGGGVAPGAAGGGTPYIMPARGDTTSTTSGGSGGPGAVNNGPTTGGAQTTGGASSPTVLGNQNAVATVSGDNNQIGNGNIADSYNTTSYQGWGTGYNPPASTQFQTPVLDALYGQQKQSMQSQAPQFNFQAKPQALKAGGKVHGALTRCIKGQ